MWVRDGGISTGRGSARVLKRSGRVRLFTIPTVASFQGKTVRASIACFYAATPKAAAFAVAPTTGRASLLPIPAEGKQHSAGLVQFIENDRNKV